jgi:hypothetical protein
MAEYDKELTEHEAAQADSAPALFDTETTTDAETPEVEAPKDDTAERLEILEGFVKHHLSTHGEFDTYLASLEK